MCFMPFEKVVFQISDGIWMYFAQGWAKERMGREDFKVMHIHHDG